MIYKITQCEKAGFLFAGWEETLIRSCLQGVMGHIYGDSDEAPVSTIAVLGDFCFLAGKPDKELVMYKPGECIQDFVIMVPQNEAWGTLVEECYQERAKKVWRYAIKKEPEVFSGGAVLQRLQTITEHLEKGYTLKMMDEALFWYCRGISWCRDWVSQYDDFDMYRRLGLGVVILKDGEPVSGASSYCGYSGGIEVEIDTREDYRRKGLAAICGAKLILECVKKGWYPSWDAQNLWSAALAEKLGYHFSHAYTAYEIQGW